MGTRRFRWTPARVILLAFFSQILVGALLLCLPFATRTGESVSFLDAMFTAASATCVTGLALFDTVQQWSWFGQGVILLLIQVGGLGVITMAMAAAIFSGRKIGLKQRFFLQESLSAPQMGGVLRLTGFILKMTAIFEGAGILALALRFCPEMGLARGLWYAVFHSVSAFCNAGFDLMGCRGESFVSLTHYAGDPVVNLTVMLLIILGGLGFFTWYDLKMHRLHFRQYALQTKIILVVTGLLLVLPAVYLFFVEFSQPQWASLTAGERFWAALFQSVTPRTAGFNTVPLPLLSPVGAMLLVCLMLIGGAPGSTAGGMKVTTVAALALSVRAAFRRQDTPRCFGRRLPKETALYVGALLFLYLGLFLVSGAVICLAEGVSLEAAFFETASALGTVGLSMGITPELGPVSKVILMTLMFFGRVGGLTMMYALTQEGRGSVSQLPEEKITVG